MIYQSVSINGINMLKTYKMALKERHCVQPPEPKRYIRISLGQMVPWTCQQRYPDIWFITAGKSLSI